MVSWQYRNYRQNILLKDFTQNWLFNSVALNVKPTSLQTYNLYVRKYILPKLGDVPVQELTPAKLDTWIRELQKAGYAQNTLNQSHAAGYHDLDYAGKTAESISFNPANYILGILKLVAGKFCKLIL